jgi:dCMP deaminase
MASLNTSREKWDGRFWELAQFVAKWSKDPDAAIGSIVANERGVIAMGYNGFPKGVEDTADRLNDKDIKLSMVVHAEQNALLLAGPAAQGAELFVWGKPICSTCAGVIIQARIKRVVCTNPKTMPNDSKWKATGITALKMLREAKVEVVCR